MRPSVDLYRYDQVMTSFIRQDKVMDQDLQEVLAGSLPIAVAERYLSIYLGDCTSGSWQSQIGQAWSRVKSKKNASEVMRNVLSHAILISTTDKSIDIGEIPENFFHRSLHFRQLHEHNWFEEFQKVVERDIAIDGYRAEAKSLGVIDPIEYQPYTRQAYNWLYSRAEDAGDITPENKDKVSRLLKNLVYAYGGAAICNIFTTHPETLAKVWNWRTGYFFERILFQNYSPEQVMKIKKNEISKTNAKLVKRIRTE